MLALVKTQKGEGFFSLEERHVPAYGDDEVLVRVAYGGICGTDIHILHDQFTYYPPVIVGHEFSGVVEAVGNKVTLYQKGDAVVGEPHNKACGKCYLCRNGHIQNCMDKRSIGWGIDGCFTTYVVMPEKLLHKVPEGVSLKEAAMTEPSAIVAHQLLERAHVTAGDNVVIMGVGPIALLAAQMARISGAGKIILCGCTSDIDYRLKIAGGATHEEDEIYYILSGKGKLRLDDEIIDIAEGQVIFIPAGCFHALDNREADEDMCLLTFWRDWRFNDAYEARMKIWGKSFKTVDED